MYTCPIQIDDVRYNAADQSFEASVTVHDNSTVRTYACAIKAPLSMSYEEAAKGLSKQAIQLHQHRGGLFSETGVEMPSKRLRRGAFTPSRWLTDLLQMPQHHTA